MRFTHSYVLLIWALLSGYIYASRITNNNIKDTANLPPDLSTPTDQAAKEPVKSYTEDTHAATPQFDSIANVTSYNQTNQQPATVKEEIIIPEKDGGYSFRTDLYKETLEDPKNDHAPLNAINLFAQRISHAIFQTADVSDKGVPTKSQSLIWSPFSVYQSLVPLFYAAGGETRVELENLLLARVKPLAHSINMTTNDDVSLSSSLFLKLSDVNDDQSGDKPFSSVTGLFARSNVHLNPDFVQEVQTKVRNVEVKSINFSDSANGVKTINTWANESTQGLINDAVNENQMDPNMFMMLVNCVRFKASWKTRFDESLTTVGDFHGVSGIQKVQMMKQIGTQKFAKFPIIFSSDEVEVNHDNVWHVPFSVLEMPYEEKDLVSLFILPDSTENIPETLKYIESVGVNEIRRMLDYQDVEVLMPKFKLNSDVNLEQALFESGLTTIFNPATANLTNLVDPSSKNTSSDMQMPIFPPYLSNIIHRTMFETSEEGTTAAAVTAMSIVPLSALSHDQVFLFKLDRPFIVLLVKNDDTMVFQGVITDLNGQELDERNDFKKEVTEKKLSNVIAKNSLIYPTDNESKEELNKLINLAKENQEKTSESKKPNEQSQKKDNNEKLDEFDQSTDERAWWIPSRIPEYLNANNTSLNFSVEGMHKTNSSDKVVNETLPTVSSSVQPQPLPPPNKSVDSIQYTKYQQPEPKDPNGIRFPATRPLNRNKANIKPRYENSEHYKNSLLKWMSVY